MGELQEISKNKIRAQGWDGRILGDKQKQNREGNDSTKEDEL